MADGASLQLYDPRNGDIAFKVSSIPEALDLSRPQRSNCFTVAWLREGRGHFHADLARHEFAAPCLLFFVPYQMLRLEAVSSVRGLALQFHANFLCVETSHAEVGCNGVLFNDVYGVPCVQLDATQEAEVATLAQAMRTELEAGGLAHADALLSYLKLLLVKATRLKLEQQEVTRGPALRRPVAMEELRRLIEEHFRVQHSPAWYAARLHLAPKSLAKLAKFHFGKTLTELIRERVLRQAKWELLHTLKPVKQVAAEVGYEDELYFSRVFKRAAGCSPTFFREFETRVRDGTNVWVR